MTLDDEAREYLRRLYTQPTDSGHPARARYLELLAGALDALAEAAERYGVRAARKPDSEYQAEWSFHRPSGDRLEVTLDVGSGLIAWRLHDGRQVEAVFEPQVVYDPDLDELVGRRRLQDGVRRTVEAEFAIALLAAFTRAP
ncbi:MAG: hypothetical protein JRJ84_21270 [Deltaproteobacteria bacterium]|nr:hypothetical protein [Deltaproteobacteria bacterium]